MQGSSFVARRMSSFAVVVVFAAVVVLAGGVGALAAHQFSDVGDDHAFHDEISAVADAGITTGFPNGEFRPGSNVTRQALAAFTTRSSGRVGLGAEDASLIGNDVDGEGTSQDMAFLGRVTIDAGAAGSGNGFVLLNGSVTAFTDDVTACPCELITLLDDGDAQEFMNFSYFDLPGQAGESGFSSSSDSLQWVVPVAADSTRTFDLYVGLDDTDVDAIVVMGELTGLYVPFGPDGGTSLGGDAGTGMGAQSEHGRTPRSDLPRSRP